MRFWYQVFVLVIHIMLFLPSHVLHFCSSSNKQISIYEETIYSLNIKNRYKFTTAILTSAKKKIVSEVIWLSSFSEYGCHLLVF